MPAIHIYGASGSGTSTLGNALHEQYQYYHFDTDDYFWVPTNPPFTQSRPVSDRLALIKEDISKYPNTVISGALCGWGDELIPLFDLVIRLVVPTDVRLERLRAREFQRFGDRIREGGDMHEKHMSFLQWASEYDTGHESMRSSAMHDQWQQLIHCRHLTLDGTLNTQKLLDEINAEFPLLP